MDGRLADLKVVGLFAGVGGIEEGFRKGLPGSHRTLLLSEIWGPARLVLQDRFPGVELQEDVQEFDSLPDSTDLLSAGFPCTDLSQAGRTAGIRGNQSGLVRHVFEALRADKRRGRKLPWLLIENVPNMLVLDRGEAMNYLIAELEDLGYRWAYRTVDSRFTGVPQRRRRVVLLASQEHDPGTVLFADDDGAHPDELLSQDAYGFYWTEGLRGLGWAVDALPTLKGGSTIGIPSPPALWIPGADPGKRLLWPNVEDAEVLQGFPRDWTVAASDGKRQGDRWKLVGNAVTVGVFEWVARRLDAPGLDEAARSEFGRGWPTAACGANGRRWRVEVSEFPIRMPYMHILDVVDRDRMRPMSVRETRGFLSRLERGNLGRHPGFREDVREHLRFWESMDEAIA